MLAVPCAVVHLRGTGDACIKTMTTIDLALFAYLSEYQPDGEGGRHPRTLEIEDGTTIADLIARLGLPDEPRVVFINGRHAPDEHVLAEGERLAIFPPVAGG